MPTQDPDVRADRVQQKAATRARILKAARLALQQNGYEATNIRQLAKDAGVATGTVLLHFKDKLDLLHSAFFEELAQKWEDARETAQHVSLEEDLVALAAAFFDFYRAHPNLARTLLKETMFPEDPWAERFRQQNDAVRDHVAVLVRGARDRGAVRDGVNEELFCAAYLSLYRFVLAAWLMDGHSDPVQLFRSLLGQHLDGVGSKQKQKGKKDKKRKKKKD